jgi:serine/threonine-protein kinase
MPSSNSAKKEPMPFSGPQLVPLDRTLRCPAGPDGGVPRSPRKAERPRRADAKLVASDRFVEQEVIGRGGMSVVIRARDTSLERDVAIKLLPPESLPSTADIARLSREARITARLDHPAIIPVYEFGIDPRGVAFFSMKLVEGETLEETLSWAGASRLEPNFLFELLDVFDKVCDAVAFAHSRGVLHLDLKPANVMIAEFGQVYVADWGVARPTILHLLEGGGEPVSDRRGLIVGTPHYMAPEQLHGQHDVLDERTDVFLLGAMLYQILTGEPPRDASSLAPKTTNAGAGEAAPPAALARIATKAMAHDPEDRYPSVAALVRDVRAYVVRSVVFSHHESDAPADSRVA